MNLVGAAVVWYLGYWMGYGDGYYAATANHLNAFVKGVKKGLGGHSA